MKINSIVLVTGDDRFLETGDTLLATFRAELDGVEYPGRLLRTYRDGIEARVPRGKRRIGPLLRRDLGRLAHAAFKTAGGVEPPQPVVGTN